mgnify:CR=1 FL=1
MIFFDSSVLSWWLEGRDLPKDVHAFLADESRAISAVVRHELVVGFSQRAEWPKASERLASFNVLPFGAREANVSAAIRATSHPPKKKTARPVWHRDAAIVATAVTAPGVRMLVTGDEQMAGMAAALGVASYLVTAP